MKDEAESKEHFRDYVKMPWDDTSEIFVETNSSCNQATVRWSFIQTQLNPEKRISNPSELVELIKSYNVVLAVNGKQLKPAWKCTALFQYFENIGEADKHEFFMENGTLHAICNLALQGPELVQPVKLLKTGFRSHVSLHQLQIASLLANAFMCTYPIRDSNYPSINFNKLFEGSNNSENKPFIEKIKCVVHYFKRVFEKQPTGNVTFHRLCILDHKLPRWDKTTASLRKLKVEINGKIEDQNGYLQMDFANRYVGGGVLGRGCVQEEIRFIICPELILARLFTQCLADNEALLVIGAERYSRYIGFGDTFQFDGDYRDPAPFDDTKRKKTYLIVVDALYFNHSSEQYRESKILRELKKAYVGFKQTCNSRWLPLATGNWGCGAFRGDPQLKSILQLMASSQARRDILYLTFGDSVLKQQIDDVYQLLKARNINVGTLYRIVRLYNRNKKNNQALFDFIKDEVTNYNRRSLEKFPVKRSEKEDETTKPLEDFDFRRDSTGKDLFDPDGEWGEDTSFQCGETSRCFENNMSSTIVDVEMTDVPSPSLLSTLDDIICADQNSFEEFVSYSVPELATDQREDVEKGASNSGLDYKIRRDTFIDSSSKPKKMNQLKITDCFIKK